MTHAEQHFDFDPIVNLQEHLGINAEEAADLASIKAICPAPGQNDGGTIGDLFAQESTPKLEMVKEQLLGNMRAAVERGETPEDGVRQALGMFAMVDPETGRLQRAETPFTTPAALAEAEKK